MIGGVIAGAMSIIALQVFSTSSGAERGGALLTWVSGGVQHLIAADKAGIPNLARPASTTQPPPSSGLNPAPGHGAVDGPATPVSLPTNPIFQTI